MEGETHRQMERQVAVPEEQRREKRGERRERLSSGRGGGGGGGVLGPALPLHLAPQRLDPRTLTWCVKETRSGPGGLHLPR